MLDLVVCKISASHWTGKGKGKVIPVEAVEALKVARG
jgi:hypothetical protein